MFNGGMYGGYAPNMSQNYMPNYGTPSNLRYNATQSVSAQRCEIIRVNGKEGAEAYPMAQNSSILLLDENNPIVWLKRTDGAGFPTVEPFTISPYKPEPPIDLKAIDERLSRVEAMINEQSNPANAKRSGKSADKSASAE